MFWRMQWKGLGGDEGGSPIRGYTEVEGLRVGCPPLESAVTHSSTLAE